MVVEMNENLEDVIRLGVLILFVILIVLWNKEKSGRAATQNVVGRKSPWFASLISIIMPGLGHQYHHQSKKGIAIFVCFFISMLVSGYFEITYPTLCVWLYAIVDAYISTLKYNKKIYK